MNTYKQLSPSNVDDYINSLPEDLRNLIQERVSANCTVSRLRKEYNKAVSQLAITRASDIKAKLQKAVYDCVSLSFREYEQEIMTIDKVFGNMEDEDCKASCYLFITLFFLTDMVESAIMDIDSYCKKINPDYKFKVGTDLLHALKLSKTKMYIFSQNFPFFKYEEWGGEVDKLYGQIIKRAGVFTRFVLKKERKEHESKTKIQN